jgi:hypothetical protein
VSKYRKFLVAAAGAVVLVGDVFLGGVFFSLEIETSLVGLLTALSVYQVPNEVV